MSEEDSKQQVKKEQEEGSQPKPKRKPPKLGAPKSKQASKQTPKQAVKQEPKQQPAKGDTAKPSQPPKPATKQEPKPQQNEEATKSISKTKQDVKQDPQPEPEGDAAQSTSAPKQETSEESKEEPQDDAAKTEKAEEKEGEDLTTLLNESQRADLTLLLANATESMRKLIEDNFNASAGLNRALLRENMTEDEKIMNANVDPGTADVAAFDRERKLKEQYEKDLAAPKMKELKEDALKAFDRWRENVIERVGQVVNSERTVKEQLDNDAKAEKALPQAPDQDPLGSVVKDPADEDFKLKFRDLYPPIKTPLTKLRMQQRTMLMHSLFLLLLSLEHYNAPSRVLLMHLTSSLKLPLKTFEQDEATVAKGLLEAAKELSADQETKKRAEANKENRKWKVGLATAAGAAVIGISGGLAAPLVSAGVGTIMGSLGLGATAAAGYLGSVAGSTVVVGGLFGAYGGRMTGQMMDHYAREVEDFEFLPVHSRNKTSEKAEEGAIQASEHNHKLRVTICISGWLTEKDEVVSPWKVIGRNAEVFALKWELEALLNLGNAMNGLVQSAAWGYAQKQLVQQTIFADLMAAMWPIGLVKAAGVIDNPFSVAKSRSEKAGEVLADALINRAQGERPVTLLGYSLGARVIYSCLMTLAKRKAFGLVESAVLIGAPTPSDTSDWRTMRSVVSARLVNVYSENDYVLGFMYRTSSVQYGVAGLQKVEGLAGVENINVSEDVKGHLRYRYLIGSILKKIGFEDIDMEAVEEEHVALQKVEAEEKKNSLRAQKNRLLRRQSAGGEEDEAREAEEEANEIQKQVEEKTQKSLVTRVVEYFYMPKTPTAKDVEKNLNNLQKAAADPGEAGKVAMEAVQDIRESGMSYAQWATQKLPSLPGRGGGATKAVGDPAKAATGAADTASKTAGDAASTAQSYTQAAASYLPSFGGKSKKKSKDPAKAVGNAAKGAEGAVDKTPGLSVLKDTTKPTVVNASKTAGDSASKGKGAAEGAEKKAEDAIDQTPAKAVKDTTKPTVVNSTKMGASAAEGAKDAAGGAVAKSQDAAGDAATSAKKATGDAQRKVGETASSTQKAAGDTAASAQSYTQRAAGYLPSLGGGKKAAGDAGKTAKKEGKEPAKAPGDTADSAQSYTSKAAGYLPSFGGGKKVVKDTSKAAGDATKDTSKAASDAAKDPSKGVGEAAKTPSKAAEKATDGAKVVTGGKKPSVPDAQKGATDTAASTQGYTSRAAGYLPSLPSIPGRRKSGAAPSAQRKSSTPAKSESPKPPPIIHQDSSPSTKQGGEYKEEKMDTQDKSYVSKATGYLPSAPSMPSVPGFGGAKSSSKPPAPDRTPSESKKQPPKLERKASEAAKSVPKLDRQNSEAKKSVPKLERKSSEPAKPTPKLERQTSDMKKAIPKLDRKPSGVASPPPKLERTVSGAQKAIPKLDRTPSGMKSPPATPAKPSRTPSGVKSPPTKLDRTPSGVKSPAENLEKTTSGLKSMAPNLDSVSSGVKKPQETVQKGVSGLTGGMFGGK
jgi:Protein of unknown function (DUF726)